MKKIIKIALAASIITLLGCSGDGSAELRIMDPKITSPAGEAPAAGLEDLLDDDFDD